MQEEGSVLKRPILFIVRKRISAYEEEYSWKTGGDIDGDYI